VTAPGAHNSPSSAGRSGREPASWPRRTRCERCLDEVLLAKLDIHSPGRPMVLDVAEVLPAYPCDRCKGTGRVGPKYDRHVCGRCHGTRHLGEQVSPAEEFIAIDKHGLARRSTAPARLTGEALHRRHHCHGDRDDERPLDEILLELMDA
jgi:hypothetical protein